MTTKDTPPLELIIASGLAYMADQKCPDLAELYSRQKKELDTKRGRITAIYNQLKNAAESLEEASVEDNTVIQNVYE